MTPETLPIDRRFKGVGRIHRASGTMDPDVRRRILRAMTTVYQDGRLDVLRAVRDGVVSFLEFLDAVTRRQLDTLAIGDTAPKLADAMKEWIEDATPDYSKKHAGALETSRRYFEKHDKEAKVADLPRILEELRKTLGKRHPRSFNMCRSSALAFVRGTLKRSHRLYTETQAVEPRKVPKHAPRGQITPEIARNFFPHPESDVIDAIAWAMLTTGMGSKEYYEDRWATLADRVRIYGEKRGGRRRDVPLVQAPAVPTLGRDRFEKRFRERFQSAITPYQLRRTYAQWMEAAGIPRTRRRLYMGHGVKDVTDLYEQHELSAFLVDDAVKLRKYAGITAPAKPAIVAGAQK